jgi:hypothetical protein
MRSEKRFAWHVHVFTISRNYNETLGGFDETKSKINRRGISDRT